MAQAEWRRRRETLFAKMAPGSAALFFAAPEVMRNSDTSWPYRQDSDFWYFAALNEPEAVLMLIKRDETRSETVLFNRTRDPQAEIWTGRRLGQQAAPEALGVDKAFPFAELPEQLPQWLNGLQTIYHAQGRYAYADTLVFAALEQLRQGERRNLRAPATLTDWRPWVHEMRLIKSPYEQTLLRRAGEISALAHNHVLQCCRPGMYEYQLEGEIQYLFSQHGARFPAYPTIVGGGENGCILHYTENAAPLRDGDLVLIDAGCEYQSYAGDITRTFPINGRFSPAQRAIYDLVLKAQRHAVARYRPGVTIRQVNDAVVRILTEGLVALGVLQGDVETLIEQKQWRAFYMHGLSHWLGLDVHDVGDYGGAQRDRPLEAGMVLTVEPGLYIAPDAAVPEAFRGIGVRIEDNLLITPQGNQNLTAQAVKDPDEIEALMAAARRS